MSENGLSLAPLQSPNVLGTAVGLQFHPDISFDEWLSVGTTLTHLDRWVQFAIGDWILYGEKTWGETYAQAMDETGIDYQRLADYVWVAKAVPFSVRKEKLSWSHHKEVARFSADPPTQRNLLDHAAALQLSAKQLRVDIRDLYGNPPPNGATPDPEVCPYCGQSLPHNMLDN